MIQHPLSASQRLLSPSNKLTGGHTRAAKPLARFAGAETGALKHMAPKIGNALKHLDFRDMGISHVNQIQIVYAACILWRLAAANERRKASPTKSWNEIRESALRDSVGYAFWFFGTPALQRLYLAAIPKDYKKALMQESLRKGPPPTNAWQHAKEAILKWNPITGYAIPTSEQVKDLKAQALNELKTLKIEKSATDFQKVESYYKKLLMHRNIATGIGLLATILLLGIGINFLNFYLTRRNMERRAKELQKPAFPAAPPIPKFQIAPQLQAMPPFGSALPQQRPPLNATNPITG